MAAEKCKNCKYRRGTECKRNPPILPNHTMAQFVQKALSKGVWPKIENDEWCGEYEAEEA